MSEPIMLRKIPLDGFIDILMQLYNKGADYIDLMGMPDEIQDVMSIFVRKEYINPENNSFGDDELIIDGEENVIERKLTDDDLNALL